MIRGQYRRRRSTNSKLGPRRPITSTTGPRTGKRIREIEPRSKRGADTNSRSEKSVRDKQWAEIKRAAVGRGAARNDNAARKSLSRRSILNILKGVGAGLGAAVILGKETIVAFAQQITGVPGSPSATTTIDGKHLPPPPPKFGGVIKESAKDSKPWWPPRVVPPKGAPNVLLIMTDDQGYGVSSTFGGVIPTPALDRIAKAGLALHAVPLHRALLADARGADHRPQSSLGRLRRHRRIVHRLSRATTPSSGRRAPPSARSCEDNGYATSWFGKNHNTPAFQYSAAGPSTNGPSGMGFRVFLRLHGRRDRPVDSPIFSAITRQIFPWIGKPGYNLTTDLADEAIEYMSELNAAAPDKPFFVYYVPGGTHSPHQPTQGMDREVQGQVRHGLERLRERDLRQPEAARRHSGEYAQLTPWPDELPKWDSLVGRSKRSSLPAQAEVFAAYAAYTDHEIGRVIQEVEDMGKLDNTLIIYISGDNGTSAEGTLVGTPNQMTAYNGILTCPSSAAADVALRRLGLGQDLSAYGGAHGRGRLIRPSNGPSRWRRISAARGRAWRSPGPATSRTSAASARSSTTSSTSCRRSSKPPASRRRTMVNGIKQKPIEGVSMAYTFDKANANAPSKHETQYFEMVGNRAIYHDGWIATRPRLPRRGCWQRGKLPDVNDYKWELYNIAEDYSEYNDLAAKMPDKLKEMQALFLTEAAKYNVFPLDNSRFAAPLTPRPSAVAGTTVFTYTGEIGRHSGRQCSQHSGQGLHDHRRGDDPQGGARGMIVTAGRSLRRLWPLPAQRQAGLRPTTCSLLHAAALGGPRSRSRPGKHTIVFDFKYDGPGSARAAPAL